MPADLRSSVSAGWPRHAPHSEPGGLPDKNITHRRIASYGIFTAFLRFFMSIFRIRIDILDLHTRHPPEYIAIISPLHHICLPDAIPLMEIDQL